MASGRSGSCTITAIASAPEHHPMLHRLGARGYLRMREEYLGKTRRRATSA